MEVGSGVEEDFASPHRVVAWEERGERKRRKNPGTVELNNHNFIPCWALLILVQRNLSLNQQVKSKSDVDSPTLTPTIFQTAQNCFLRAHSPLLLLFASLQLPQPFISPLTFRLSPLITLSPLHLS